MLSGLPRLRDQYRHLLDSRLGWGWGGTGVPQGAEHQAQFVERAFCVVVDELGGLADLGGGHVVAVGERPGGHRDQ